MLFIMRGTSLSGKDTFINSTFNRPNNVLSSDNFRELLFGDMSYQGQNNVVFDKMYTILEHRLIYKVEWTVLNATNLRMKDISIPVGLCGLHQEPFTIISIQPPSLEELMFRAEQRIKDGGINIPTHVLTKHLARYEGSLDSFVAEAKHNPLCTFVEIDQNHDIIQMVQ